jgi:hypothetical protein
VPDNCGLNSDFSGGGISTTTDCENKLGINFGTSFLHGGAEAMSITVTTIICTIVFGLVGAALWYMVLKDLWDKWRTEGA